MSVEDALSKFAEAASEHSRAVTVAITQLARDVTDLETATANLQNRLTDLERLVATRTDHLA